MLSTTIKSFTANLDNLLNEVENNSEPLLLKRKGGNVMILAERDYTGLIETLRLLSTEANSNHLKKSIENIDSGNYSKTNINDLWK
jgi:PHD/YefM family antitoxin component YafN of YafNO toxin-antitoxin module